MNLGSRWAAAAVCVGACLGPGRPALADDGPTDKSEATPKPGAPLEQRWISVGTLTRQRPTFFPDRGPFPARTDEVNDEVHPLFGGEGEEGVRPYGAIDEVIDLVKARTPRAGWSDEGVVVTNVGFGNDRVLVRGPRALLDTASATIADLEREGLSVVVFDVLALEGDAAAAAGEGGPAAALRSGALRVVAATRACAAPGQRVTAFAGGERAYLQDHDVEVAEEASSADPIVGVLNEGLCFDARPALAGGVVRADVHAWVAGLESLTPRSTSEGDLIETPVMRARETTTPMLKLVPGTWTYLAASKDFGFALRATVRTATATPGGVTLPVAAHEKVAGTLETAMLDVSDLGAISAFTRSSVLRLSPSNWKPPEPPELPEPRGFLPMETLVETVKATVDPESWESEGTSLEIKNGRMIVRTDAGHVAATRALLAALRDAFVRSYRVKATLVSLPLGAFPELVTGLDDGASLLADGGAALLARPGARIEDRASVRVLDGARTGVDQGTLHRYVGDYDVEIAKKAPIGKPRVFDAMEGLTLDVEASTISDGSALALGLRMDRCTWRETRRVKTRHGDLELPSVGMDRVRGSLVVPLGATRLAGLWTEGDRVTLVLVTATAE